MSGVQSAAVSYFGEFHCNKYRPMHVTLVTMFMPMVGIYQPLMGLFIMPVEWNFSIFGFVFTQWQ